MQTAFEDFMAVFHDEVEIEDFEYDEENGLYHYPCPCGDRFEIAKWVQPCLFFALYMNYLFGPSWYFCREMLEMGEDVATCPSCSLIVRVIYDPDMFIKMETLTISSTKTLLVAISVVFELLIDINCYKVTYFSREFIITKFYKYSRNLCYDAYFLFSNPNINTAKNAFYNLFSNLGLQHEVFLGKCTLKSHIDTNEPTIISLVRNITIFLINSFYKYTLTLVVQSFKSRMLVSFYLFVYFITWKCSRIHFPLLNLMITHKKSTYFQCLIHYIPSHPTQVNLNALFFFSTSIVFIFYNLK
uniref:Diphthamide biosynthesis protein 3 n=1 Tax=Heterorhabditis bacteriophora TaxID=37862 RepID=A0A1I7WCZ4_HETBA